MKFLCVECDEQMRLTGTKGPERGSMTVLFECVSCGKQTAMLTNSMETQMVSSLGVSIGGRVSQPEPMEMLRSSLITEEEPTPEPPEDGAAPEPSTIEAARPAAGEGASKCPFTAMVNDAMSATRLEWTDEARERMERIPDFVRPMVKRSIEDHAEARGLTRIDRAVLDAVRGEIGM